MRRGKRAKVEKPREDAADTGNTGDTGDTGDAQSLGLETPPATREELARWIRTHLKITAPSRGLVEGSSAPMDYLAHAFFEGAPGLAHANAGGEHAEGVAPADCVVWANRGGGKTFLGAVATLLDLLFKPGIEVRILGGSMEQSKRMHAHLRRLFDPRTSAAIASMVHGRITDKRIRLRNGSEVEVLAQSQTAVRGTRVQKLRCDEVDLFHPDIWAAAQLTTRSKRCGPFDVRGGVECLSTMHVPHGVMHDLVREAREGHRALFRWGVVDVLAHCPPRHRCEHKERRCPLWDVCQGRAKLRPPEEAGHLEVTDALAMQRRVARSTWETEMLCLRPRRSDAVLPEFDPRTHVVRELPAWDKGGGAWVAGMDFGFRAPTVIVWGYVDELGRLFIADERSVTQAVLADHVAAIKKGLARGAAAEGEDSDAGEELGAQEEARPATGWPACAWIGVDPAGNQRSDQTGVSSVALMRREGLTVRCRRLSVHEGLNLIRARLSPADNSPPRLFVHERCTTLIESLERYHYPAHNPASDTPDKTEGFDHAVDALRYLVQNLDQAYRTRVGWY